MMLLLNLHTQFHSVVTIAANAYSTYTTTSLKNVFPCMMSKLGTSYGFTQNGATSVTLSLDI